MIIFQIISYSLYIFSRRYEDQSKDLQYFGNRKHSSLDPVAFAEGMKLTNLTRLRDTEITWYFPSASLRVCLYGLKHGFKIHCFRSDWLCLFINAFKSRANFLEVSASFILVNCNFSFRIMNFSCYFHFDLVKHKFPNKITLQVHVCFTNHSQCEALYISAYELPEYY